MTIHETCKCGAVLDFTSGSSNDIRSMQLAFEMQHRVCIAPLERTHNEE